MRKTISPPEMCDKVDLWNEYLEYWTMYRWKDCVDALNTHHTASCFIKHTGGHPLHYCGNVWWANSKYIKMLHKPNEAIDDTVEMWLLSDLYAKGNSHMGELDYFKFMRKQHFYSVHQPTLTKFIDNPYNDRIERDSYKEPQLSYEKYARDNHSFLEEKFYTDIAANWVWDEELHDYREG